MQRSKIGSILNDDAVASSTAGIPRARCSPSRRPPGPSGGFLFLEVCELRLERALEGGP